MRLLSGGAQFPEGTWSEARLYCGHDAGPAAAGCSRHERGGDSNQAFYWCDNNGPVSVSCTCGGGVPCSTPVTVTVTVTDKW